MECVPAAGKDAFVQRQLDAFCKIMDFQRQEVVLELSAQWPMHRARWWTIMMPAAWNKFLLHPWPTLLPRPTVGSVLPSWGAWPLHQEQDLLPDRTEFQDYSNKQLGCDKRLIEAGDTCPVMLHSYGAVHRPCPCGCRSSPISPETLRLKGLRGYFVRSRVTNLPRFLHPLEAAILMTIPPNMNFEPPVRDALCLIGNAAPPLQCLWVMSHLQMGAARHIPHLGFIKPDKVIDTYKKELCRQAAVHFPDHRPPPQWLELDGEHQTKLRIWCQGSSTVAHLLEAEHITLEWGHSQVLREGELLLPPELELSQASSCSLSLEQRPKRQCLSKPIGNLIIAIVHHEQLLMEMVEAGTFLFVVLRKLQIDDVLWVVDETGALYSADYRIWESHRFFTLGGDTFPALKLGNHMEKKANGTLDAGKGLSVALIAYASKSLCQQVESPLDKFLLLAPLWFDSHTQIDTHLGPHWLKKNWDMSNGKIILPVAIEQHWILLCAEQHYGELHWHCFDGLNRGVHRLAAKLVRYISRCLQLKPMIKCRQEVHQEDEDTCGTILLAHLCLFLGLKGIFCSEHIAQLHRWLSKLDTSSSRRARGPPDPVPQLAEILKTKGVEPKDAKARAKAAVDAIGQKAVQQALTAKNPWMALKQAANQPKVSFKFMSQTELENHIAERAATHFGASSKSKKHEKVKKKQDAPLHSASMDPSQVKLIPGYFIDEDGDDVAQVQLAAVVKDGSGVAVCTLAEASPFLAQTEHLSSNALALLVLDDSMTSSLEYAEAEAIRFAAICPATEESLLLRGWLVQLGDLQTIKKEQKDPMKDMSIAPTRVIRVLMYKDEIENDWTLISASPIKTLMSMAPIFMLCRKSNCGTECANFHPPVDEEPDAVVHEIWSRRFQSLAGPVAPAHKADVFSAYMRVQKSALSDLLRLQVRGLYIEPRAIDAKGACPDYAIIWLSDASYDDVLFKFRTTANVVSIVRSKMRYGLRVESSNEEEVHRALKPHINYVKVAVQGIYHVHPLPFGMQRAAMQKLLGEWSWTARALQPARGSSFGGAWTIGAEEDPPCQVLPAFGRDVLINKVKSMDHQFDEPSLAAPKKTQTYLRKMGEQASSSKGPVDPWLQSHNDPWLQTKVIPQIGQPVKKRIDSVTEELRTNVKDMIQKEMQQQDGPKLTEPLEMFQTTNDRRFNQLESSVKELTAHNRKFQAWFQESGTRTANLEAQVQVIAGALESTQQEVRTVKTEVKQSSEALGQVSNVVSSIRQDLNSDLEQKFSSFASTMEALLAKKQRMED